MKLKIKTTKSPTPEVNANDRTNIPSSTNPSTSILHLDREVNPNEQKSDTIAQESPTKPVRFNLQNATTRSEPIAHVDESPAQQADDSIYNTTTLPSTPENKLANTGRMPNTSRATLINKLTMNVTEARVPDVQTQPRMHEIKKPHGSDDSTSCHAGTKTQSESLKQSLVDKLLNKPAIQPNQPNQPALTTNSQTLTSLSKLALKKPDAKPKTLKSEPDSPAQPQKKKAGGRDLLYGTGLTKKVAQQAEKQQNKAVSQTATSILTAEQAELGQKQELTIDELPDSLMDNSIQLDEYQQAAVNGLSNQKFGVLIGAAGTGKTTALKFLLSAIENHVTMISSALISTRKIGDTYTATDTDTKMLPAFAFCSFTGKAVQQMKRALPEKYHPLANTIHATLGYAPVIEEYYDEETKEYKEKRVFRPSYNSSNKLPYKIIIVDETGTLSLNLWHELLNACTDDCRIFFIGDLNQLPPVQGHSILGFAMLKWPTYTLEKLHRQAEGDPIAENAHRILQGKKPLTDEKTKRFIVKNIQDGSSGAKKDILGIIQHLHKQGEFDPMQDALIVPQNIGNLGQESLNDVLVNYFNAPIYDDDNELLNPRVIIKAGYISKAFAVGDKVMLLANNTQLGLTNGMVGIVTSITPNGAYKGQIAIDSMKVNHTEIDLSDLANEIHEISANEKSEADEEKERQASHVMLVKFQNVEEEIPFETAGAYNKVAISYAMTCHKAQGSEYRNIIVVAHASNLKMLCREWLYTAITRAKQRVILLTNHRGLTHAINAQKIKGNTIAEKAKKFLALQGADKNESPATLPKPQEIKVLSINKE